MVEGGGGRVRGVRVYVNEELKFLGKFKKNGGSGGSGGHDGCERRIEVFVKIQKQIGGGGGPGVGLGGQGGCERRIEVFVKIQKKIGGGGRGGSGERSGLGPQGGI